LEVDVEHRKALASIVSVVATAVVAATLVGCTKVADPTPIPSPGTSIVCNATNGGTIENCGTGNGNVTNPAPSPSPSGGAKVSDVKGWGQFFYGWAQSGTSVCPIFNEANKHADGGADFTLPAGCEGAITCTPFSDKDVDPADGKPDGAKDPSRNVTWSSAGPVSLTPPQDEPVFNRRVKASGSGIATIKCDFVDSAGVFWSKTATYSVHGS
jgi:hypothetical protein